MSTATPGTDGDRMQQNAKKVFQMGGAGVSIDGTKSKREEEKKSPSRLTRNIPQIERKKQISDYLSRKNSKKSLLTQNLGEKMYSSVQEGVDIYNAKKAKEAGQMLKEVYLIEKQKKTSNFKVDYKQARKEINANVKGKWVYDMPLARLKPGESRGKISAYKRGKAKDFKDIPDRYPATLLERT